MIYEYECPIHHIIEVEQKMSEDPLKFCPECQKDNKETEVKRLISASSFQLIGRGWSNDNYHK